MTVIMEKRSDGTYIVHNTGSETTVVIGTGDSVADAKADFERNVELMKESYIEDGIEVPAELNEPIEYNFDISSLFDYFKVINVAAFAKRVGMNAGLLRQYKRGGAYISDKQLERVEAGIHELGEELSNLKLV